MLEFDTYNYFSLQTGSKLLNEKTKKSLILKTKYFCKVYFKEGINFRITISVLSICKSYNSAY